MANITYSVLQTDGLRLAKILENEVRTILHDNASIRNSGALLFAGDLAGSGSSTMSLRFTNAGAYAMDSFTDGTEITSQDLVNSTEEVSIARQGLRYDLTDMAALTGIGQDVDVYFLASKMAQAFEERFMELVCATFTGFTTSAGTSTVDLSVDDFQDAIFKLEIADNSGPLYAVLHGQQIADLRSSVRGETANAIAFAPASAELLKAVGNGLVGSFLGVQLHKSSFVVDNSGYEGAIFSQGAIAYAQGTPQPVIGQSGEVRPAGTPLLVEIERDAAYSRHKIVASAYCGAAIVEQARGCLLHTDA